MPGLTADAPAVTVGAADMAVSISAESKNVEASKAFVKYLSSTEVMQKYYDVDGSPTSVKGIDTEGKFEELADVLNWPSQTIKLSGCMLNGLLKKPSGMPTYPTSRIRT